MTDIFDRNATKGVKTDTVLTEIKDIELVSKQTLLYFSHLYDFFDKAVVKYHVIRKQEYWVFDILNFAEN